MKTLSKIKTENEQYDKKKSLFLQIGQQILKQSENDQEQIQQKKLIINKQLSQINCVQSFWERKKRKKQYMQFSKLTPINLEEEKNIFFQSKYQYNPIFLYNLNENQQKNEEMPYQICHTQYLNEALKIMNNYLKEKIKEKEKQIVYLSQEETTQYFNKYIQDLNLQDCLSIEFQENILVPTCISHNKKLGKSRIIIRIPIQYTKDTIMGTLNHEIGTHFVRKYNNKFQKNINKDKQIKNRSYIKDEEGLAVLNQLYEEVITKKKKPYLYKSALNYYAAYLASNFSFQEIFKQLEQYIKNPDKRFILCMRVKRGIKNTAQHGGMFKDQVYLIGSIEILEKRNLINFQTFHQVKLNVKDYLRQEKLKLLTYDDKMIQPYFLKNIQLYQRVLDKIAFINFIN